MSRLHKNKQYYINTDWTVEKAREEINQGLALLNMINNPIVTFFGSHRIKPTEPYWKHCHQLAYELGKQGYAIMSGGGPGFMYAANAGATAAQAPSVGLRAELLTGERVTEPIYTATQSYHFLFARRFIMSIKSEALIFYPGGYGTLNELFEYAVLMQTQIVDTVPIICVIKEYWQGLFQWLHDNPLQKNFFIRNNADLELLYFVDDVTEIIKIIEQQKQ